MPKFFDTQYTDPALDPGRPSLVAPTAVTTEGDRIRAALAAGSYGNQPVAAAEAAKPIGGVTPLPTDAEYQRKFGDSFFNQPSMWEQNQNPAQLRRDLLLDELRSTAAQRRFDLENSQTEAPLRNRLLQAQINASGSHDRFLQAQDAQTLEHTHGFFNDLLHPNAPSPQDPGYRNYVLNSLVRNPRFAETPGGQHILNKLSDVHDTHLSVADVKKNLPAGFDLASIHTGANGQSYTVKPSTGGMDVAEELKTNYGLKPGDLGNPTAVKIGSVSPTGGFSGNAKGDFVQIVRSNGTGAVIMPIADYERLGGKYSPGTQAARGAVAAAASPSGIPAAKHLGTYNPETGEFDQ